MRVRQHELVSLGKKGGKRQTAKEEESVATSSTDRISHCRAVIRRSPHGGEAASVD